MDPVSFLKAVITTPEGFFNLSTAGNGGNKWAEHWYEWPRQLPDILAHALVASEKYNVYFSAHLFEERVSKKEAVLPTRTIQADLDSANIYSLPIAPTALVRTSAERHQGFWVLKEPRKAGIEVTNATIESISRRLTYAITDCDRTGWPLGKRLRFPSTLNHKYETPQQVEIIQLAQRYVDLAALDTLPEVDAKFDAVYEAWVDLPHEATELRDIPPVETIINLFKAGKISSAVRAQYTAASSKDRSGALWRLMCELFAAGCTRDLVYWLAFNSRNNKFLDRRYGGVRDLRKDVLRAEVKIADPASNIKEEIAKLDKATGMSRRDKDDKISEVIIRYMQSRGSFLLSQDREEIYIRADTGRAVHLTPMSSEAASYLTMELGINSATQLYRTSIHYLRAYCLALPSETEEASLSFFDLNNRTLYLHSGYKDIAVITPDEIRQVPNGSAEVFFRWSRFIEPLSFSKADADASADDGEKWYDVLYNSSVEYCTNLTPDQAKAVLAVWTIYALFRTDFTRPILALFGQPGSGKSTLAEIIYRLFYGRTRGLASITDEEDFKHATSRNPVVIFDNADTWQRWLPDKLATSISNVSSERRRLFTDRETIEFKSQAMVALTAHSPKFIREDVADRLLVIILERRPRFIDSKQIMNRISDKRNSLWGQIVRDIQSILRTKLPDEKEVPQFRIQDFSLYGTWIARGLGEKMERDFREGLIKIKGTQSDSVLESDQILVIALDKMLRDRAKNNGSVRFMTTGELFTRLTAFADDANSFKRAYKNASVLGRKLWTMQEALKSKFIVEFEINPQTSARNWKFDLRDNLIIINNERE